MLNMVYSTTFICIWLPAVSSSLKINLDGIAEAIKKKNCDYNFKNMLSKHLYACKV